MDMSVYAYREWRRWPSHSMEEVTHGSCCIFKSFFDLVAIPCLVHEWGMWPFVFVVYLHSNHSQNKCWAIVETCIGKI